MVGCKHNLTSIKVLHTTYTYLKQNIDLNGDMNDEYDYDDILQENAM